MRYWILALLLLPLSSQACSYAYHYGLFPLGGSEGAVLLLEVELERYVKRQAGTSMVMPRSAFESSYQENAEVRWKGRMQLLRQSEGQRDTLKAFDFMDFLDENYQQVLQPVWAKAYDLAAQSPHFQPAEILAEGRCNGDNHCRFFERKVDEQGWLYAYFEDSTAQQAVTVPLPLRQKFENRTRIPATDLNQLSDRERMLHAYYWKKQGLRRYRLGEKRLLVYSFCQGQSAFPNKGEPDADWQTVEQPIERFIRGQAVAYHGFRFDCLQVIDEKAK